MQIHLYKRCHGPTFSQARNNRRVYPNGVNNTFRELAQDFQTPVHTYNRYITGEYQTKFEKTPKDVYIYRKDSNVYKYTTQQLHFIQKCLIQHTITKEFIYTICYKGNTHQELQQNASSCPAHGG